MLHRSNLDRDGSRRSSVSVCSEWSVFLRRWFEWLSAAALSRHLDRGFMLLVLADDRPL